jgi:hypothetical protein
LRVRSISGFTPKTGENMEEVITLYVDETTGRPLEIHPDLTGARQAWQAQSQERAVVSLDREAVAQIAEFARAKGWL